MQLSELRLVYVPVESLTRGLMLTTMLGTMSYALFARNRGINLIEKTIYRKAYSYTIWRLLSNEGNLYEDKKKRKKCATCISQVCVVL